LPRQEDLPPPTDSWARSRSLFVGFADRISFRATVSTEPDQIAVAPGYLMREWTDNGRRYFVYDMGETPIQHFVAFVSARYAIHIDRWRDVEIQIFHDPKHPYNIIRMTDAIKAGLDYFTTNFGPYQFRQFRVLEFPRYRGFAQSFPNTVPFAESHAFIGKPATDGDLDTAFYVTLHELAHQWWGHQVIGAFAEGSNVLSEMLAEYSALMVLERVLGPERLRLYMKHNLDQYLTGRRNEREGEQTLARVTRQGYVWYQKGSLAIYALKDAIGEDRLNAALRGYLERVKFQGPPYTTVDEFLDALRAATPPDRQGLITDLFETLTLFDNRAVSATWRETPDHKYVVTMKVAARKLRSDPLGKETPIAIDDDIDIGVFAGEGRNERALFLEKRRMKSEDLTFDVVVDERPTRAGVDPYHKLIDRTSTDNVVTVTRGGS
jgi:aminopeptidase N